MAHITLKRSPLNGIRLEGRMCLRYRHCLILSLADSINNPTYLWIIIRSYKDFFLFYYFNISSSLGISRLYIFINLFFKIYLIFKYILIVAHTFVTNRLVVALFCGHLIVSFGKEWWDFGFNPHLFEIVQGISKSTVNHKYGILLYPLRMSSTLLCIMWFRIVACLFVAIQCIRAQYWNKESCWRNNDHWLHQWPFFVETEWLSLKPEMATFVYCKFHQGQVLLAGTLYHQESSGPYVLCAP